MSAQKRGASPPHPRPNAPEARPLHRDRRRRSCKGRRCFTHAGHRDVAASRSQRSGIHPPRACPIRAGGRGSQLERLVDNPSPPLPPSSTARALFSAFFLFLRGAEKRLYPTECKTKLHTHRQEDKNHLKTHNNRYVSRRSKRDETSIEPRRASRTTTTRSRISRDKTRKNKEKISYLKEYEKKK
jgi:hypothetical protein